MSEQMEPVLAAAEPVAEPSNSRLRAVFGPVGRFCGARSRELKETTSGGARKFGMVFALLALIIFFQWRAPGGVLTSSNAQTMILGNSFILVMTMGMVMVIIAGHIDLSVGSVAATVGTLVALATHESTAVISGWGWPRWAGVLLGLAIGLSIGALQGFLVAYVGIPGFITTLAGMMIWRGVGMWILAANGSNIPVPYEMRFLGGGHLPDIWSRSVFNLNGTTLILGVLGITLVVLGEFRKRATAKRLEGKAPLLWISATRTGIFVAVIGYLTWLFGSGRAGTGFPVPGVIILVLAAIYWFITTKTINGRNVYAVGGNKHAAALSGVNIKRTNFLVMMNMSLLASVAAIIFVSRSWRTGLADGTGWELDVIASVFIGGAAVSGGVGTVIGSLIGGMVMVVLNNGLILMGVGTAQTNIIKGVVLIAAVAFDVYNKVQGRPSLIGKMIDGLRPKKGDEATLLDKAAPVA
ncbi:MAG: sugar ABC transporter permease [Promicromonosporaceae bacterium]|nr:sugar ABC transporter permease [Promicromonosporaceae bacterium]